MANIVIIEINPTTGMSRHGGAGTVYSDMTSAMTAAEAAADAYIATNGGTKITNTTSNRVYVKKTEVITHESDLNLGDSAGDGLTISKTSDSIGSKWYCFA